MRTTDESSADDVKPRASTGSSPRLPRRSNKTHEIADPSLTLFCTFAFLHSYIHTYSLHRLYHTFKMVAQTAEFKKAVEDSRKLKAKPSDDELLQVRHAPHEHDLLEKSMADDDTTALRTLQAGYPGPPYRAV